MKLSLRSKLIIIFLLVVIITGLVATVIGVHLLGEGIIKQAQDKVREDLNSARHLYCDAIEDVEEVIHFTAVRFFVRDAILKNDIESLEIELEKIGKKNALDILTLTDENGRILLRTRNPTVYGDSQAQDEIISKVLLTKETVSSTTIVSAEELRKEGEDLKIRAYMKFIPTPRAKPRKETQETKGMMIKASSPILDEEGKLIGILYGGKLLNRNYEIVDKIKNTVFQDMKYKGKDIGTATIFQGDLRISTNVKNQDGTRAIGTRVSEEVYTQVLEKGLSWVDRAFVVNNWYITAYEPIKNIKNEIIGILYVGILEEKFVDMKRKTMWIFLGITITGVCIAIILSWLLSGGIVKPIKSLVFASRQLADGNLSYRVSLKSRDEIGQLGDAFNSMASSIKERDEQLKEGTRLQLMRSEKLAALGRLAASIAHEINNPLGSILLDSHLLLEECPSDSPNRRNLEKIVKETTRCRDIVRGLLDFARQTEPKVELLRVEDVLDETISFIGRQSLFQDIKINKNFSPTLPKVMGDRNQLKQVFTNIILNAAEVMEGNGSLTINTALSQEREFAEIEITDTGPGISEQNLKRLFEPFFTTKEGGTGTGLGLSIAYGIVEKHKGNIEVRSKVGGGSTFVVRLPVEQGEKEE